MNCISRGVLSRSIASVLAAGLLVFGPGALAAGDQQASAIDGPKIEMIDVIPAQELVGRQMLDKNLKAVGELKYLMIRPDTAAVTYALIGTRGEFDIGTRLVAVPWDVIDAEVWVGRFSPGVTLKVTREEVEKARRWDIERLSDLTTPTVTTEIYEYFGAVVPDDIEDRVTVNDLIVGQGVINKLGSPILVAENQVRGVAVETELGGELGVVDEVMIDLDNGRVAYVLLERGGYLGSGSEWLAVPLQAFQWSGFDVTVDLNADAFRQLEGLDRDGPVPAWVHQRDLKKLYTTFDVRKYW